MVRVTVTYVDTVQQETIECDACHVRDGFLQILYRDEKRRKVVRFIPYSRLRQAVSEDIGKKASLPGQ